MIGSFHESMTSSRHYSSSGEGGNPRNSIDENSTCDDLMKVRKDIMMNIIIKKYSLFSIQGNSNPT